MINANDNASGKWIINPMFIQPKAKGSAYNGTAGCVDSNGNPVPCTNELGNGITNTAIADAVYCNAGTYDTANCSGPVKQ